MRTPISLGFKSGCGAGGFSLISCRTMHVSQTVAMPWCLVDGGTGTGLQEASAVR